MYGIIVVGHGKFAEGLLSSIDLILGSQKNITSINFDENDSTEVLKGKIVTDIRSFKDIEGIIFLTDLAGGTPFKTCVLLSQNISNSRVIAGTNLPMLIEILMNRERESITDIVNIGISTGKDSVVAYEVKGKKRNREDRKNGI